MRLMRQRAADIWHVLALLYIGATYAIWAFEVAGGFRLILRGTLLTIAILVVTRLLLAASDRGFRRLFAVGAATRLRFRSEEHTSELQSLMSISYAVLCLKKKTIETNTPHTHPTVIVY